MLDTEEYTNLQNVNFVNIYLTLLSFQALRSLKINNTV